MEAEARFRAMGADAHLIVVGGGAHLVDGARELIEDLELRWSRFRPASEVSLMNAMAGAPVRVSETTRLLVERSLDGARATDGRFDPTVLGDLIRAGYGGSYETLPPDAPPEDSSLRRGCEGIVVDRAAGTVALPLGVGFDPGGIGKGLGADLVVRHLLEAGADGACVNLGGDLRVAGRSPIGSCWAIAVDHPLWPAPVATVGLVDGAVATSARTRRTLGPPQEGRHHLIDPRTGASAAGMLSATAIAAEGWQAEVLAKAVFVSGVSRGLELLDAMGAAGLVVDDEAETRVTRGLERFRHRQEQPA